MTFDFFELYQNYSTIELLKIVRRPDDYQREAVDAATNILTHRTVTTEDESKVEKYYQEIDNKEKEQKGKLRGYTQSVTDLVDPIVHPKETVEPRKLVNILLLLIALQYGWWFYNEAKGFIRGFNHGLLDFEFLFYYQLINLIYVPLIFFLVYKRKRWGWIFLFADSLFTLVLRLSQISFVIKGYTNSLWFVYAIFIRILFLFVLWRPMIADHFRVNVETKKKTLLIVILIALLFIAGVYIVYD